jgi:hypothetical protein
MWRQAPSLKRLAVLLCLVVPALAWAFVKPVRVVMPGWADVTCAGALCIDDLRRAGEAEQLLAEAQAHVERQVGPFGRRPRAIFCARQACADHFGLGARSAVTLASVATVIGPNAWKPHYVRHELLHHAQSDRIGPLALLFKPAWVVEGMAYGLSEDPRSPLAEPFESQRKAFLDWYGRIDRTQLWPELRKL